MVHKAAPALACLGALAASVYLALPTHPWLWPLPWLLMLALARSVLQLARQATVATPRQIAAPAPEPTPAPASIHAPAAPAGRQELIDISDALPMAVYHMENASSGYRRFNFVSTRVKHILGVSAQEILNDPDTRFRHVNPDDLRRLQAHLAKTTAEAHANGLNPPPFEFEFRVTLEGEERWTRAASLPIRFLPGDLSVWCGYYEDITERKRNELRLLTANNEQNAILEAATVGIAFIRQGQIQRHNRQFAALFEAGPASLVGQTLATLLADDPQAILPETDIRQAVAAGGTYSAEMPLNRASGTQFWAQISIRAVYPDDPLAGKLWLVTDITQRRHDHALLMEAKQAAEEAARAKSEFLANMSHEIRTPLNTVIGLTHLLGETVLAPQQADYLKSIQRSSRHLLRILNDILDLSKAEAGRLHVEQAPFTLESILQTLQQLTVSKAEAKGLALVCEVAPDVPTDLVGDPLRLGQILLNYTDNAVKFTERGTVTVRITRETPVVPVEQAASTPVPADSAGAPEQQVVLRFAVQDTGIGLSQAQADKLFQNFSQADASTTRKFGGTGLGLAICKRLAELMGGQVGVDSVQGQGSTFWFTTVLGLGTPPGQAATPRPMGRRSLTTPPAATAEPSLASPTVWSEAALKEAVVGLQTFLREGDSEALDFLEQHRATLQAAFAGQFPTLQSHIKAFDFDEARELAEQWQPAAPD